MTRFKKHIYILFVILFLIPCVTFAKLYITVTTSLVADLTKEIVADNAEVHSLMGPGVDPHLYKATASDLNALTRADIVFYNGLHLEGRMTDIFESLSKRGKNVFPISASIPESKLLEFKANTELPDPHIWFDPALWTLCAEEVTKRLSQLDPSNAKIYTENLKRLRNKYRELTAWNKKLIAQLPQAKRILITSHDAYNYFGRAFDFQVVGVQGISTVSEAGLADIVRMVDFIKEKQVKAIFVESSVSPAAINRISQDSCVAIGGELFSDALGPKGDIRKVGEHDFDVGTYSGMFKYNVSTIVEALK